MVWAAGGGGGGGDVIGVNYKIVGGVFYLRNAELTNCFNRIDSEGSNGVTHLLIYNCEAE